MEEQINFTEKNELFAEKVMKWQRPTRQIEEGDYEPIWGPMVPGQIMPVAESYKHKVSGKVITPDALMAATCWMMNPGEYLPMVPDFCGNLELAWLGLKVNEIEFQINNNTVAVCTKNGTVWSKCDIKDPFDAQEVALGIVTACLEDFS